MWTLSSGDTGFDLHLFAWRDDTALFYVGRVTELRNLTVNVLGAINFNRAEIYGQFVGTFTADEQKSLFSVRRPVLCEHKKGLDPEESFLGKNDVLAYLHRILKW